jgi:hypothetical protein
VYTEYFVRGTEPNDYCPLHFPQPSAPIATTGGATGAVAVATPVPLADTSAPAPVASTSPPPAPTPITPPPAPRRGFWGRIFHR